MDILQTKQFIDINFLNAQFNNRNFTKIFPKIN